MTGQSQFAGVWCPSITPMDNDGKIDLNGLSQHLKRLTEAKIDVILLMGSIGEFCLLYARRKAAADPRSPCHELAKDGRQRLIHLPE